MKSGEFPSITIHNLNFSKLSKTGYFYVSKFLSEQAQGKIFWDTETATICNFVKTKFRKIQVFTK